MISASNAGRNLISDDRLFSTAERIPVFLIKAVTVDKVRDKMTHWQLYSKAIVASSSFCPSCSNLLIEMKGWSAGQEEIFGSLLF